MSSIQEVHLGDVEGKRVSEYTMINSSGTIAKIINYGAILTELHSADRNGNMADIVLGCDSLDGYLGTHPHFGSTVGRVANRTANCSFSLDGQNYSLSPNHGKHHLHGGIRGIDKHVWIVSRAGQGLGDIFVKMILESPDGDQGYPGNVEMSVYYMLTHDNILKIHMEAKTDRPTIVNLANHSYFNLSGHQAGTVLDHEVQLHADRYTPTDPERIPTGAIDPVAGTPFDFTSPKIINTDIDKIERHGQEDPGGYDHNFVINDSDGDLKHAATVTDAGSGRKLEVHTDQPGVQFYTGNFLNGSVTGKDGVVYQKHAGFCLETQKFPDAIHHEGDPGWPSIVLRPDETYTHEVEFKLLTI